MTTPWNNPTTLLDNTRNNHAWVLSFDKRSLSRTFVAKDWPSAMRFFQQVHELAGAANHAPELHLTEMNHVRVVLRTTIRHTSSSMMGEDDVLKLAQSMDQLPVDYCPQWWKEQQELDMSDEPVKFDESHYQSGLNGNFVEPDAVEKFGSSDDGKGEKKGIFENEEIRDIAAAKEELVRAFKLSKGDVVADIGAGTGLLEPLLSEAVGDSGRVIASELSPLFRKHLAHRLCNISNVEIVTNPTDRDPKLPLATVDVAILVDVYHHLEFPQAVLRQVRDALKRHGALIVVDFHRDPEKIKSHDENWVYQHLRADQSTFTKEIERTGFVLVEEVTVKGLPENYFLVFRKRPLPLSEPGAGWTC